MSSIHSASTAPRAACFLCIRTCVLVAVWAGTFGPTAASKPASAAPPNVLLIMADDVGSDAIACYGGESHPTPNIDALAAGGMKFTHAFAMPVCHPSRICLMTGRYPFRYARDGMRWGDYPEAAEGNSIGDVMKRAGYATAVAGKWQLCLMKNDPQQPRRTGFDAWSLFGWHEGGRYHDPLIYQNGKPREDAQGKYGPDLYVEFLIDFMRESQQAGQPFFAYYPMALCHDVTDDLKGEHVAYHTDGRWMTYAEMISSMDDRVGRLVAALDQMGLRERTLILFTTDNGTPSASYLYVDDDGKMVRPNVVSVRNGKVVPGGKGKHDDTGTRVPLIANWPGHLQPGTVSDAMVDLTDYLPTLVELAGGDWSDQPLDAGQPPRDGISFAPILRGQPRPQPRKFVFSEHRGRRSIRSRGYRLYEDGKFFDLARDPRETAPLTDDQLSETARDQRRILRQRLRSMQPAEPGAAR